MAWASIRLNDGNTVPGIAFGSATRRSEGAQSKSTEHILHAIQNGFIHLDTAQQYGNEAEVGSAIRQSGVPREKLFVTTKWSDGTTSPRDACETSLRLLGLDYVDMYVIHHTWTCREDFAGSWRAMEDVQAAGLTRSIGLSAFGFDEVQTILKTCRVVPAVNMIMLHPGVLKSTQSLLDLMEEGGIVPGGYSSLKPLWDHSIRSSIRETVSIIAERLHATPEAVLLQWCASKGAIVYTSSTNANRLKSILSAGEVTLKADDITLIDKAGSAAEREDNGET